MNKLYSYEFKMYAKLLNKFHLLKLVLIQPLNPHNKKNLVKTQPYFNNNTFGLT